MSREHIPLESPAQDYIDSLRAELAEARARESALIRALGTIRGLAKTGKDPQTGMELSYDEAMGEIEGYAHETLNNISPAAKALLERAQKAEEYREALRLADYAVHFGNCDPCSWDTDAFTKCDCGLFQLLLAVRAVLGKEGE